MKQIIFGILVFLLTLNCEAQITMLEKAPDKIPEVLPYDSLSNFQHKKYGKDYTFHHLIGQTIMCCGKPYVTADRKPFNVGSYYKITGILLDDVGSGLYDRLELTDVKTGEKFTDGGIFERREYNYFWIVQGFYEKMKSLYVGKKFIYIDDYLGEKGDLINLQTDAIITQDVKPKTIWTCIDVRVRPRTKDDGMEVDYRCPLVLIVDNEIYGKHYCYYENKYGRAYEALLSDERPLICGLFQDKEYYENVQLANTRAVQKRKAEFIRKYGNKNGALIAMGKIVIGMNKKMCRDAWGAPDNINTSTGSWGIHEQWVYGNSYVYFDNGLISAIQN